MVAVDIETKGDMAVLSWVDAAMRGEIFMQTGIVRAACPELVDALAKDRAAQQRLCIFVVRQSYDAERRLERVTMTVYLIDYEEPTVSS